MPASLRSVNLIYIQVDGSDLAPELIADLEDIYVDMTLGAPDMVTLRFSDPQLDRLEDGFFTIGKSVVLSMDAGEGKQQVATVEVSAIEPDVQSSGVSTLLVRCYGKMARMHFERRTRSFLKKKDSDLASQIAGEVGLSADVTDSSTTHEYMVQWNQTDMEFLLERANRIGYQLYSQEGKLFFQPAGTSRGSAGTLRYAESLISFQPRLSAIRQATQVTVRGWDPKTKQAIVGVASSPDSSNQGGIGSTGGAKLQSAYGTAAPIFVVDEPVSSQAEAQKIAQGLLDQINREWVEIEGVAFLSPRIKPAYTVTIEGVPGGLNGSYFVTSVRHAWNQEGGSTTFTVSGRISPSVTGLLDGGAAGQRIYGVWPALVTNNNDPDNQGRVKVKYAFMPQNSGADLESDWARIASPMAGSSRGFMALPEVNDEVLVAFGGGNPANPYIIGVLWNGRDAPPLTSSNAVASGAVKQRIFKTRAGHKVLFDDSTDAAKIRVDDNNGQFIEIVSKPDGSRKITISGEKDMDILCKGNLKIEAKGTLNMTSTGAMTIKSNAAATFEAASSMTIKSNASMTVSANASLSMSANASAELKANAALSLSSSGIAELKGSLVKIN